MWNAAEPGRGQVVRARWANHHTASMVFTRDDAEGHPGVFGDEDARNWWSHDKGEWMSWKQIGEYLSEREEHFVVEVLTRPGRTPGHRMCQPDGMCHVEELDHDAWI